MSQLDNSLRKVLNGKTKTIDLKNTINIIDDRLYFMISKYGVNTKKMHMFSIDNILRYEPFFVDFGPLNLGCLYKFCKLIKHKLKDNRYKNTKIIYYCGNTPQKISNACWLIGGFMVIELNKNPYYVYNKIKQFAFKGAAFRDASMGICTYRCTVEHCLYSIYRCLLNNWLLFDVKNGFNVDEYEHYEKVECGDLNIIIPNKFIAFAGPYFKNFDEEGYPALTPDFYIPIWKKFNVTTIIRLNKKCYDKRIFTRAGYKHYDLYFIDGTTPNENILNKFIDICETNAGTIAVHCKAGLGRTGSCIGCYIMKHYRLTAAETIAWLRICRPGSVIGPQQQFLEQQQPKMWKAGDEYRKRHKIKLIHDPRIYNDKYFINEINMTNIINNNDIKMKNNDNDNESNDESKTTSNEDTKMNDNNSNNNNINIKSDINHKQLNGNKKPLQTDPGQRQGSVLHHAKYDVQHKHNNNNNKININDTNNNNNNNK